MTTLALQLGLERLGYPNAPAALTDVQLEVWPGERVAVIGGNGTGKTALLKTSIGLLPAPRGGVHVFGHPIGGSAAEAVRAGAGLVFQNPDDQLFGATVLTDVLTGPRNQGLSPEEAGLRARAALRCAGIAHLGGRRIETLSFGERKRACLAGVLAMRPALLLLDEPTAGLDPVGELAFVDLLRDLAEPEGVAVVAATHAVDLVPLFADRLVLLGEGRILADGPPDEVFGQTASLAAARVRAPAPRGGPPASVRPLDHSLQPAGRLS